MTSIFTSTAQAEVNTQPASGQSALRTVVWMRGEHDLCSAAGLVGVLDNAVAGGATAVVVDLSGVTFMDASTVRVLVNCSDLLVAGSRTLCLRNPSGCALRVLDVCGLAGMVAPDGG